MNSWSQVIRWLLCFLISRLINRNETGAASSVDCLPCNDGFYCPDGVENSYGIPCNETFECPMVASLSTSSEFLFAEVLGHQIADEPEEIPNWFNFCCFPGICSTGDL